MYRYLIILLFVIEELLKRLLLLIFFPWQRWRHYRVKCLMINLQQLNVFIVNERQFTVYSLYIIYFENENRPRKCLYLQSIVFLIVEAYWYVIIQSTVWYNPTAIKFVHVCHMIMTKCQLTTVSLSIYINVYNILL